MLAEFSTPQGMKAFTDLMSMAAGGAAGNLRKARMLAEATGRVGIYLEHLGKPLGRFDSMIPRASGKQSHQIQGSLLEPALPFVVLRHCPWLLGESSEASEAGEHGCALRDCSGNVQRVHFAVDTWTAYVTCGVPRILMNPSSVCFWVLGVLGLPMATP